MTKCIKLEIYNFSLNHWNVAFLTIHGLNNPWSIIALFSSRELVHINDHLSINKCTQFQWTILCTWSQVSNSVPFVCLFLLYWLDLHPLCLKSRGAWQLVVLVHLAWVVFAADKVRYFFSGPVFVIPRVSHSHGNNRVVISNQGTPQNDLEFWSIWIWIVLTVSIHRLAYLTKTNVI